MTVSLLVSLEGRVLGGLENSRVVLVQEAKDIIISQSGLEVGEDEDMLSAQVVSGPRNVLHALRFGVQSAKIHTRTISRIRRAPTLRFKWAA